MTTERLRRAVYNAHRAISRFPGNINMLVGCGYSGLPLTGALANALDVPAIYIRKSQDWRHSHSARSIEGDSDTQTPRSWLFIDDLIASGRTFLNVTQTIRVSYPTWELAGAYLSENCQCYQSHQILLPKAIAKKIHVAGMNESYGWPELSLTHYAEIMQYLTDAAPEGQKEEQKHECQVV